MKKYLVMAGLAAVSSVFTSCACYCCRNRQPMPQQQAPVRVEKTATKNTTVTKASRSAPAPAPAPVPAAQPGVIIVNEPSSALLDAHNVYNNSGVEVNGYTNGYYNGCYGNRIHVRCGNGCSYPKVIYHNNHRVRW